MNKFEQIRSWFSFNRDVFVDLLRIYLGVALFLKGIHFLNDTSLIHESLGPTGMQMGAAFIAHLVPALHILGGAMLAIGLITRLAALIQVPILFGAVFFVHLSEGLFTSQPNLELSALVLVCLLVLAAHGSGRLSVDNYLTRLKALDEHPPAEVPERRAV